MKRVYIILALLLGACSNNEIVEEKKVEVNKTYEEVRIEKNIKEFKKEYKNKVNINEVDEDGNTVLHRLVLDEDSIDKLDKIEFLIKQGIDIDVRNKNGETFIDLLIKAGDKEEYEILTVLSKYKEIDFKLLDESGNNYLVNAVVFSFNDNSIEIIELLLNEGLNPNHQNNLKLSPLSYLMINRYRERNTMILYLLIDYGLDINQTMGNYGETALMWICTNENNVVDENLLIPLLEAGANPNIETVEGYTAFRKLIENENLVYKGNIAQILIDYGADVNYIDRHSGSPLLYTALNIFNEENQNLLPILIASGANIDYRDEYGNSLLTYVSSYGDYQAYYSMMELLLLTGVDVHSKNNDGETALMVASKNENASYIVLDLLNLFGANIDDKDKFGNTPLSYAAMIYSGQRESDIIKYLVANGADIYSENIYEYTPLMLAVLYANKEKGIEGIGDILSYYPSVNEENSFGYTPLMVASQFANTTSSIEAIEFLIENGADLNHQQKDGTTALMIAAINTGTESNLEAVIKLIELGADINLKIKEEWHDEEHNVKWEVGDTVIDLSEKYIGISSTEETVEYLEGLMRVN